jgi:hypothetical protein
VFGRPILTPALFDDERAKKAEDTQFNNSKHKNKADESQNFAMSYIPPEFYDPE